MGPFGPRVLVLSTALLRCPCIFYNISTVPGACQALGKSHKLEQSSAPRHGPGGEGECSFRSLAATSATTFFPAEGFPPRLGEGVNRRSSGQDGGQALRDGKVGVSGSGHAWGCWGEAIQRDSLVFGDETEAREGGAETWLMGLGLLWVGVLPQTVTLPCPFCFLSLFPPLFLTGSSSWASSALILFPSWHHYSKSDLQNQMGT